MYPLAPTDALSTTPSVTSSLAATAVQPTHRRVVKETVDRHLQSTIVLFVTSVLARDSERTGPIRLRLETRSDIAVRS